MPLKRLSKVSVNAAIKETRKGPILGEVVMWKLYGIEFPKEDFKTLYDSLDLPDYCWFDKRDRSALTKALSIMEKDNLIRKVSEDLNEIRYAIVIEEVDIAEKDINFRKKDQVIYNKGTKQIRLRTHNRAAEQELNGLFEKYQNLITGYDISKIFVRLCTDVGVPMNENGGVYFIPKTHIKRVEAIEQMAQAVRGSITRLGIADGDEYKKSVKKIVMDDLMGSVKNFKREIRTLKKRTQEDNEPIRDFMVDRRIKKIDRLNRKVENFGFLKIDADTVTSEAKKCVRTLRRLSSVKEEEEAKSA